MIGSLVSSNESLEIKAPDWTIRAETIHRFMNYLQKSFGISTHAKKQGQVVARDDGRKDVEVPIPIDITSEHDPRPLKIFERSIGMGQKFTPPGPP